MQARLLCLVVFVCSTGSAAVALAEGWSLPKLNLFRSVSKTSTPLVGGNPLVGRTSGSTRSPSMVTQMAGGTRKVVSGTVDLVTLKPVRQALAPAPKPAKSWQPYTPTLGNSSRSKSNGSNSWFGSWWKSEDKPQQAKRPHNEWLFGNNRSRPD